MACVPSGPIHFLCYGPPVTAYRLKLLLGFYSSVHRQVRERLKKDVEQMKLQDPNFRPGLVVLQVSVEWELSPI